MLTPEELDKVAQIVHKLSARSTEPVMERRSVLVPAHIVDQAVEHGWPRELFETVIGSLGEDFERAPQPVNKLRSGL